MTTLCSVAEEVAEKCMKEAAIRAKEYTVKYVASEVPPEADLIKEKITLVLALMALWVRGVRPQNREL